MSKLTKHEMKTELVAIKTALHQLNRACEDEAINHNRYVALAMQRLQAAIRRAEEP